MIITFLFLLFGHFLADYPLQGDFLAKAKNHRNPIFGIPWWQALAAHSAIHAGMVGIITGSLILTLLEFLAHNLIDYMRCDGKLSYNEDQSLHILCKILWVCLLIFFPAIP